MLHTGAVPRAAPGVDTSHCWHAFLSSNTAQAQWTRHAPALAPHGFAVFRTASRRWTEEARERRRMHLALSRDGASYLFRAVFFFAVFLAGFLAAFLEVFLAVFFTGMFAPFIP